MAPYGSDDWLAKPAPSRTGRLRALVVFPLLGPLLIDTVAAGAFAVLGLAGTGVPGLLYGVALFLLWLPLCYVLLGPIFLIIGFVGLRIERYFGVSGLRGRMAAAVTVAATAATLWLIIRLLGMAGRDGSLGTDIGSLFAGLFLVAATAVGCWWIEPWIMARAASLVGRTRRVRRPT